MSKWQRVGDGYELVTTFTIYRIQRRSTLTTRQKWDLDRHLGLRPRDHKRREEWVILFNGAPLQHSYSKATAMSDVNAQVAGATWAHQSRLARAAQSGPRIGLSMSLSQSHHQLPPDPRESVISHREDDRARSEHLPELRRGRYGSRRRRGRR